MVILADPANDFGGGRVHMCHLAGILSIIQLFKPKKNERGGGGAGIIKPCHLLWFPHLLQCRRVLWNNLEDRIEILAGIYHKNEHFAIFVVQRVLYFLQTTKININMHVSFCNSSFYLYFKGLIRNWNWKGVGTRFRRIEILATHMPLYRKLLICFQIVPKINLEQAYCLV